MRRGIGLFALILLAAPALAQGPEPAPPGMSSGQTRERIAKAIEQNDAANVVAATELLAIMGAGLTEASQARVAPFFSTSQMDGLKQRFAENAQPLSASTVFAHVPVEYRLVEGLAHDPATGRLFAGTVVDGDLLVSEGLGWQPYEMPEGVGGLFGMRIDPGRRRLWIASGVADPVADKSAISPGLLEMDADTLELIDVKFMPAGAEGSPGDVAIGQDGTVYVSDGLKGAIYRCRPGCGLLETLVPEGRLTSPQGMVPSKDGKSLIVADYAGGLARVDLATGEPRWLEMRDAAMLDGIDGLLRYDQWLIAIQNGTSPRRIIRITLNEDENRVDTVEVIERANPAWGEPTLATASGGRLLYIADSQWEVWGEGGVVKQSEKPRATAVRAMPLPVR
jgi:sugar lactone lactonase YvrE